MAIDFDVAPLVPGFLAEARETLASLAPDVEGLFGQRAGECAARLVRVLHTIKGTASCMHLDDVAEAAHRAESVLLAWWGGGRGAGPVGEPAIRAWLVRLATLCDGAEIAGVGVGHDAGASLCEILEQHAGLMRARARRAGLEVRSRVLVRRDLSTSRFDAPALRRALLHVLNNCVDHAAQPSDVRESLGKAPVMAVTLGALVSDGSLVVSIADDGPGVDLERVASTARDLGLHHGPGADAEASLILFPGVTSRPGATPSAGRGLGLDAAAASIAESGGSVSVTSEAGVGTTLTFRIPLLNRAAGSDDTASDGAGTFPDRRRRWTPQT